MQHIFGGLIKVTTQAWCQTGQLKHLTVVFKLMDLLRCKFCQITIIITIMTNNWL